MVDKDFKTAIINIFKETEKTIKHEERNGKYFLNELLDMRSMYLRF